MLLAALIIGLIAAYYLGFRAGGIAAAAAAGLFIIAALIPGLSIIAYAAVAVGLVALFTIGPKRQRPPEVVRAVRWLRRMIALLKQRR